MKIFEEDIEIHPPGISDGFYKFLAILTALDQDASIVVIDEIENSLYAENLQYIIDELKHAERPIVIATHSPTVVDLIDLEDLIIVEKTAEGSVLKRIKDVEKLKEKLHEQGITYSESWLYGNFGDEV
ncbi:MAG: AAA family ATPase [Candidatus Hermodarchaeota archaeon]